MWAVTLISLLQLEIFFWLITSSAFELVTSQTIFTFRRSALSSRRSSPVDADSCGHSSSGSLRMLDLSSTFRPPTLALWSHERHRPPRFVLLQRASNGRDQNYFEFLQLSLAETKGLYPLAWLQIHANTIWLSVKYVIFSNLIRDSSRILFPSRAAKKAACNSRRGIVNSFSGATLDFAAINLKSCFVFPITG